MAFNDLLAQFQSGSSGPLDPKVLTAGVSILGLVIYGLYVVSEENYGEQRPRS